MIPDGTQTTMTGGAEALATNSPETVLELRVNRHSLELGWKGKLAHDLAKSPIRADLIVLLTAFRVVTHRDALVLVRMLKYFSGREDVFSFSRLGLLEERIRFAQEHARDTRTMFRKFARWLRAQAGPQVCGAHAVVLEGGQLEACDAFFQLFAVKVVLRGVELPMTRRSVRRALCSLRISPFDETAIVPARRPGPRPALANQRLKTISRRDLRRYVRRLQQGCNHLDASLRNFDEAQFKRWHEEVIEGRSEGECSDK